MLNSDLDDNTARAGSKTQSGIRRIAIAAAIIILLSLTLVGHHNVPVLARIPDFILVLAPLVVLAALRSVSTPAVCLLGVTYSALAGIETALAPADDLSNSLSAAAILTFPLALIAAAIATRKRRT